MYDDRLLVTNKFILSSSKMLGSRDIYQNNISFMNFSTFEEEFIKQKRLKEKRSDIRSRVEKYRNRRSSDLESDTGSDGLAVHSSGSSLSGGSGRSGDWGPPKHRHKVKANKKRCERRNSFGENTKEDSRNSSTSNLSKRKQDSHQNAYRHLISNHVSQHGKCQQHLRNNPSMTRASSCSVLPTYVKQPIDKPSQPRLTKRPSIVAELQEDNETESVQIEEKENAILQQCYRNEGLVHDNNTAESNYVVDFAEQPNSQSKFPLPEHLNYPLCKYRHQSENVLNKPSPMRKLRNGIKKLKAKRQTVSTSEVVNTNTLSSDSSSHFEVFDDEEGEDGEAILARLSRDPKERKSLMKRFFNKLTVRTYSTVSTDNELPSLKRSISTRSIPDALKDMWNKVHDEEINEVDQTVYPALTRAKSMPTIPVFNKNSENDRERKTSNNIFTNFFKAVDESQLTRSKSKQTLVTGNDVITGVLGMNAHEFTASKDKLDCLNDADLSSVSDTIDSRGSEKEFVPTLNKGILKTNSPRKISSTSTVSSEYSSTSQYSTRSIPSRKTSLPIMTQQCPCCNHQQVYYTPPPSHPLPSHFQQQFVYPAPYPLQNYTYDENFIDNTRMESVIAPLDIHVSNERKAERRKISEMLFDTFV